MGFKYTRVRDTHTGHEYDVLSHRVDPAKHEPVDDPERWPESNRPRAPRHNVKGPRPTTAAQTHVDTDAPADVDAEDTTGADDAADASDPDEAGETPVSGDDSSGDESQAAKTPAKRSTRRTPPRNPKSSD